MVRQWWWAGWAWGLGRRQGGDGRRLAAHREVLWIPLQRANRLARPLRPAAHSGPVGSCVTSRFRRASVCCAQLTAHSCALPSRFRRAFSALPTRRFFGGGNCTSGGVQGGVARADGAGAADGPLSRLRANVAFQATSLAFDTVGRWQAADEGARALRPVRRPASHTQPQPAAVATETLIGDCFWSKSDLRW